MLSIQTKSLLEAFLESKYNVSPNDKVCCEQYQIQPET